MLRKHKEHIKGDLYLDRNLNGYVFNGENSSCNIFFGGYDIIPQ